MTLPLGSLQDRSISDHERDVHAWARLQEAALLEGRSADLDFANLAQETAALGKSECRALESALLRLFQHLPKWEHQPSRRCRSWSLTIEAQRGNVDQTLRDNPSLRGRLNDAVHGAYRKARAAMLRETALPKNAVPETTTWSWQDIMTRPAVWPEP